VLLIRIAEDPSHLWAIAMDPLEVEPSSEPRRFPDFGHARKKISVLLDETVIGRIVPETAETPETAEDKIKVMVDVDYIIGVFTHSDEIVSRDNVRNFSNWCCLMLLRVLRHDFIVGVNRPNICSKKIKIRVKIHINQ
jgi:hypothetical protein